MPSSGAAHESRDTRCAIDKLAYHELKSGVNADKHRGKSAGKEYELDVELLRAVKAEVGQRFWMEAYVTTYCRIYGCILCYPY